MLPSDTAKLKLAHIASREADKQRLYNALMAPQVLGMISLIGGLYIANKMPWDEDEGQNRTMKSLAMAGAGVGALSMMGVKDKYVLGGMALLAGVAGAEGGGTAYSPLQAGEATVLGAGIGSVVPGVGTVIGAGVGLGIDSIYQMVR
jgi:hypothetical protein